MNFDDDQRPVKTTAFEYPGADLVDGPSELAADADYDAEHGADVLRAFLSYLIPRGADNDPESVGRRALLCAWHIGYPIRGVESLLELSRKMKVSRSRIAALIQETEAAFRQPLVQSDRNPPHK